MRLKIYAATIAPGCRLPNCFDRLRSTLVALFFDHVSEWTNFGVFSQHLWPQMAGTNPQKGNAIVIQPPREMAVVGAFTIEPTTIDGENPSPRGRNKMRCVVA